MFNRDHVDGLLHRAWQKGPWDGLLLIPGFPPRIRQSEVWVPVDLGLGLEVVTPHQTELLTRVILQGRGEARHALDENGWTDLVYATGADLCFRFTVARHQATWHLSIARVDDQPGTLADFGFPDLYRHWAGAASGCVLLGSGRASARRMALNAMVAEVNAVREAHVLILEETPTARFPRNKALIRHMHLGHDVADVAEGIRAGLRMHVDVLGVELLRSGTDLPAIMDAVDEGLLVFVGLSCVGVRHAMQILKRWILAHAPGHGMDGIADHFLGLAHLHRVNRDRLAHELLGMDSRVRQVIRRDPGDFEALNSLMEQGGEQGWCTRDQALASLVVKGLVSSDEALEFVDQTESFRAMVDSAAAEKTPANSDEFNLRLDRSAQEVADLLQGAWPKSRSGFPLSNELEAIGQMVIFEPNLEAQGPQAVLRAAFRIQGRVPGTKWQDPKGVLYMNARLENQEAEHIQLAAVQLESVMLQETDQTRKLQSFVESMIPKSFTMPNPRFTQAKKRALERIAQVGKLQHVQKLKQLMAEAVENAEAEALDVAIQTILERES